MLWSDAAIAAPLVDFPPLVLTRRLRPWCDQPPRQWLSSSMKETARLFSTTQSDVAVSKTDGVSAEKLPDDRDRVFVGAMQELIDAGVANRWQGMCTKIAVGYYAKSHTGEVIHDAVVKDTAYGR